MWRLHHKHYHHSQVPYQVIVRLLGTLTPLALFPLCSPHQLQYIAFPRTSVTNLDQVRIHDIRQVRMRELQLQPINNTILIRTQTLNSTHHNMVITVSLPNKCHSQQLQHLYRRRGERHQIF